MLWADHACMLCCCSSTHLTCDSGLSHCDLNVFGGTGMVFGVSIEFLSVFEMSPLRNSIMGN